MAAISPSVWVVGTRWENDTTRRATFLRSADGGATWEPLALPEQLNDVSQLYRASPATAYAATSARSGPYLWRTDDSGQRWRPVPTPFEQRVHEIPSSGVHIEEIATVGPWPDPITWNRT